MIFSPSLFDVAATRPVQVPDALALEITEPGSSTRASLAVHDQQKRPHDVGSPTLEDAQVKTFARRHREAEVLIRKGGLSAKIGHAFLIQHKTR
ncbi:MAG: hypothetical protein FJX25_09390 [Alphaproteobacteria bacterium]|nr:hypothetical protein [Alphaproteobacteria bacterium]